MRISHEAVYQSLYIQGRGALREYLPACLRTWLALRAPRARSTSRGKSFVAPEIMISERPAEADDRAVPGHWEGDLIHGPEQLGDRHSGRANDALHDASSSSPHARARDGPAKEQRTCPRRARRRGGARPPFSSTDFTKVLKDAEIAISMDGRGAWRDNVFVERLWRTIKYEEVYLRAYAGVTQARASIGRYLSFYNGKRPHSALGGKTPDQAYINLAAPILAAA